MRPGLAQPGRVAQASILAFLILLVDLSSARAQYSQRECTNLLNESTRSLKERAFKRLISLARAYLTNCKHLLGPDEYADGLATLAHGLSSDGQVSEALGVANLCLAVSSAAIKGREIVAFLNSASVVSGNRCSAVSLVMRT
jgi:hypothetical protein